MSIDLHLSDRLIDLVDEDFDLAVRICGSAEIPPGGRQVGELRRLLVASPLYLADRGVPRRPSDLRRHDFVQHRGLEFRQGWFAERLTGVDERLSGARLTTAQSEAAVAAARHGLGLVSALAHQVHADLRSGALVEVLGDFAPEPLVVALVSPPNRRSRRPVRLLTEDLAPRLTEALISLGGRQKDRTSAPRPVVQLDAERSH
jgi:DNA-binding transcriptional LysR family regulator